MSAAKKKIFPKLKKSLKNFLTDESGKITKKDALGISAWAALLAGAEDAVAAHLNWVNSASAVQSVAPSTVAGTVGINISASPVCNHASGIVNWHYSSVPSGTANISGHWSHGSHSNHGDGWWC